jgi:hypothetical protein
MELMPLALPVSHELRNEECPVAALDRDLVSPSIAPMALELGIFLNARP